MLSLYFTSGRVLKCYQQPGVNIGKSPRVSAGRAEARTHRSSAWSNCCLAFGNVKGIAFTNLVRYREIAFYQHTNEQAVIFSCNVRLQPGIQIQMCAGEFLVNLWKASAMNDKRKREIRRDNKNWGDKRTDLDVTAT